MIDSTTRMLFGFLAIMSPLLPVYAIYRLMGPIAARVEGKISQWTLQIGGPAALYFILVWLLLELIPGLPALYEPWKVTGHLLLADQHEPITKDDIAIAPPSLVLDEKTGSFFLDLVIKPNSAGKIEFPDLVMSHPGYEAVNMGLSGKQDEYKKRVSVKVDPENRCITVEPVTLKKSGH
jgi:hypothetical protein